jgi:alkanesulfonate monooxygenase SsuD/methylene tetrahydromethanopterin reductase-like flavin-dependent oxidoreductase (luciferase family)
VTPLVAVFADLTDQTMDLIEFARATEDRGFGGIFLNEHTHLPISHPTSRFPAGGEIPERYARFWDPYIALSFVAASTGLEIGTAISLIGEHDPIQLGHATATLDHLSGGRLVLGIGWGWLREEFADHGRRPEERAQVLEEWVQVLRSMWRDDVASYSGRYVTLSPSHCWPKPLQPGGPPPLILPSPREELTR